MAEEPIRDRVENPVFAVYCRKPVLGRVKTRLAAEISDEAALRFYQGCLRLLRTDLLPLAETHRVIICPSEQADSEWAEREFPFATKIVPQVSDKNLGARLGATYSELADLDMKQVIFIGSDSPSLPTYFLTEIADMLNEYDTAFGPSRDGGVWAIATSCALPRLARITWSSPTVYNELTEVCHRNDLSVGVAPEWYDVDDRETLRLAGDDLIRSPSRQRQEFGTWIESLFFRAKPRPQE